MFAPLAVLLLTPSAPVPKSPPVGPPPVVQLVRGTPTAIMVTQLLTTHETVVRTIAVTEGGKVVAKTVTEIVPVTRSKRLTLAEAGGTIASADPKAVSAEDVQTRLAAGLVAAVVVADGKPLHPTYRAALAPDALVITLPAGVTLPNMLPTVPAPRVVLLKADAAGKMLVPVPTAKSEKVILKMAADVNGNPNPSPATATRTTVVDVPTPVEELDVSVTPLGGVPLDKAAGVTRLTAGRVAVVAATNQPIDPRFLTVFAKDTPVVTSPKFPAGRAAPAVRAGGLAVPAMPAAPPVVVLPEKKK